MTCGLRPADEEPVLCGESQGQREQQVQKLGLSEAQDQGAWVWVTGRNGEDSAGPVAGTKEFGEPMKDLGDE